MFFDTVKVFDSVDIAFLQVTTMKLNTDQLLNREHGLCSPTLLQARGKF